MDLEILLVMQISFSNKKSRNFFKKVIIVKP